ncbi:MAG: class I SAM-dependent rRNA methyltransferase [Gammaproteobacteria bacterium]|nr:class I SAM-dependent rRNA methyltransferase [Gammaproteobacteria bacterium]
MKELFLRKGAERRLRAGHLWVYSNEVDNTKSPLTGFTAGDCVVVCSSSGQALGSAYMAPNALICARLYAPGPEAVPLCRELFQQRLDTALQMRASCFPKPFYRLIYGDSDFLPGIVVDRFGDAFVVQFNQPGLERYQADFLAALLATCAPSGVLLRGDSRSRREQGLASANEVIFGSVEAQVLLEENNVVFKAPVHSGQKTGWFYDHRNSRARLRGWVAQKSVLDVYSYIGGWGVQAAVFGASSVLCLDSSEQALAGVLENAKLNDVADKVTTLRGSAPQSMATLRDDGKTFDVVVLDPPAFIQRRRDSKKGIAAYRRINELGLQLLNPGGLLVSASCSMHLARADLIGAIAQAAVRAGCRVQIVEQGGQAPDHPVHPAIPETEYLKAVFVRRMHD